MDSETNDPVPEHAAHSVRNTGLQVQSAGQKFRWGAMNIHRKGERGSAMLETLFSMLLLFMILFGILQLFQLALASMVTDYAAFRGARSAAVGFKKRVADREAFIKIAPVSGSMVFPDPNQYNGYRRVESEKTLLTSYQESKRSVQYAYWGGKERFHLNYLCPFYGEPLNGGCANCCHSTHVETTLTPGDEVRFKISFIKYPLNIPMHDWFTGRKDNDSASISGEVRLTNYSSAFLE